MAWIESHQSLLTHRKTILLSHLLGIPIVAVIGHLHLLWWWALEFALDGDLSRHEDWLIAEVTEWEGQPYEFVQALVESGFLDYANGRLTIHHWKDYMHLTHAIERSATRRAWDKISRWMRPQILERDGHRCRLCGATSGKMEIDHIVPIAKRGTNDEWNLQVLCRPCNRSKGAN